MTDKEKLLLRPGLIKGLGKRRIAWLAEAMDIATAKKLAVSSAPAIFARLSQEGELGRGCTLLTEGDIEGWIAAAAALLEATKSEPEIEDQQTNVADPPELLATFVVEFYRQQGEDTRPRQYLYASQNEGGGQKKEFESFDMAKLGNWMLAQLDPVASEPAPAVVPPAGPIREPRPSVLALGEVQLHHKEGALITFNQADLNSKRVHHLTYQSPLTILVPFQANGVSSAHSADNFYAHCIIHSADQGKVAVNSVMSVKAVPKTEDAFVARMANISLAPAVYQISIWLRNKQGPAFAFLELPILNLL